MVTDLCVPVDLATGTSQSKHMVRNYSLVVIRFFVLIPRRELNRLHRLRLDRSSLILSATKLITRFLLIQPYGRSSVTDVIKFFRLIETINLVDF